MQEQTPNKRMKTSNSQNDVKESNNTKINLNVQNTIPEDKPRKPLSAYIYFSQEFREIIRQSYPYLTVA